MRPAPRAAAAALLLALPLAPPAPALTVVDYDVAANERFASGFPGAPVASTNPAFLLSSFDLSGIGWRDSNPAAAVTLISPWHFVTAGHVAPANGDTVSFLNQAGALKSYTVASISTTLYNGQTTDLVVGTLSAAIPAGDLVGTFPVLSLGSLNDYLGLSVRVYGQGGRVGTNTIDGFLNVDFLPVGSPDTQVDSLFQVTDLDATTYESQAQSGDSGSPTFVVWSGQLTLVGVHSAINGAPPPEQTYDSFIPPFLSQINAIMLPTGYAVTAVPEPGAAAAVSGVLVLAGAAMRRRRRR